VALVSTFTAVTDVVGTLRTDRLPGPRPTLDGTAYLDVHRPFEALAYRWLNRTIAGSPVLLEAQGPSYQDFSRVSMNTGLPTLLGWEYHLQQRAHGEGEIFERKRAVETLYTTLERPVVQNLLTRYRVAIVFVGGLERRTYETAGLAKFEEWKDLFKPIYQNPQVDIYAVSSNFRWSETTPVVEAPKPAAVERRDETPQAPAPPGALSQPRGLAVDAKGNVWVADFGHSRIQGFDASMQPLRAFGENGEGPGQFKDLCGVAVGPDGLLYVTDTWNHRIQVFDVEGKVVREWGAEFYGPRGIAITKDGSVYVTDTGNGRAVKFTPGGKLLARFGSKGSGAGELMEPMGIAVSPGGDVFIADAGNQRVVVFAPDGEVRASWAIPGWKDQAYREPGIAVLPDGRVAVPEPAHDRILFFTPKGQPAGERKLADGAGPLGLAVTRDGSLLVSEIRSGRVTRVEKP
jgi:DNA-binding beta-propeller fold protein YncE